MLRGLNPDTAPRWWNWLIMERAKQCLDREIGQTGGGGRVEKSKSRTSPGAPGVARGDFRARKENGMKYRGLTIDPGQSKSRIAKVKSAIDAVLAENALRALAAYADDPANPPEGAGTGSNQSRRTDHNCEGRPTENARRLRMHASDQCRGRRTRMAIGNTLLRAI